MVKRSIAETTPLGSWRRSGSPMVDAARLAHDRFEKRSRIFREQLDQDLAAVYDSQEWRDACEKVAEIRHRINRADFGVDAAAMPGLLSEHEKAKAERDALLNPAHDAYDEKLKEE